MIKPIILPAGATLLSERRRGSPSFAFSIWFPIGSRNEAPEERGFVHFAEHMLFKGSFRRDALSLWRAIERTGGYANGFTERDAMCLYCCVPSADWRLAVSLMVEAAFASSFPPDEFEKERQVVLAEIEQVEDDIEETGYDAFLKRFWPGHPASLPIAGSLDEVRAIRRDALAAFCREALSPPWAIIAVSGDVDDAALASAIEEAVEDAGRLAGGFAPPARPSAAAGGGPIREPRPPVARVFRGYTRAPSAQIYYFDAAQLEAPFAAEDFFALSLVNGTLGEASTSRLFQRVREQLGLAYTVQSSIAFSKTEAVLAIQAVTGNGHFRACAAAIDEETDRLFRDGLGEGEFAEAKSRLTGGFALSQEDPESRVRRLANWFIEEGYVPDVEEERARYAALTMDDAARAIRRLACAPRARYAYGSIRAGTARAAALEEL
ncbi:insulinase family protein [bacterium]|nr:insulinase family protein [bacterium]